MKTMQEAEQIAAAYDEVPQLEVLPSADIEAARIAVGADRIIFAEFRVDANHSGGRTARRVVIGFGKGKRENFRQLRKAAGTFPSTDDMGPGCDCWQPRVVLRVDVQNNGCAYWKGSYSHWHRDMETHAEFATEAEALAHTVEQGDPEPINFDGTTATFGWEIEHESYENRENYSMGGGNYLGSSGYDGWRVLSGQLHGNGCEYYCGWACP